MVVFVEEIEVLKNENTNEEPENGKPKILHPLAIRLNQTVGHPVLVVFFAQSLEVDHLLLHLQQPP